MDKTVSSKDLIKFGMRGYKDTVDVNWHGKIIEVRTLLSQEEEIRTIHEIISLCVDDDDGSVAIELLEFYIRFKIICSYAKVSFPENLDDIYKLVYHSDLYKYVIDNVNSTQVNNIINSVKYICLGGNVI
jgi:hypothetical protein